MNSYELIQAKIETGIEAAKKEIEVVVGPLFGMVVFTHFTY
jgi:hypothetical protein